MMFYISNALYDNINASANKITAVHIRALMVLELQEFYVWIYKAV